jgi:peptidoglycan/LPS O-acetylase OafA/YrhL
VALALRRVAGKATGRQFFRRVSLALVLLIVLFLAIRGWVVWLHYGLGEQEPLAAPGLLGVTVELLSGRKGKYWEVFALGIGASLFYVWALEQRRLSARAHQLLGWGGLLLALLGLSGCCIWAASVGRIPVPKGDAWIYPPQAPGWSIFGEWLVGLCFLLVLVASLTLPALQRSFGSGGLRFLGKISYSLYLWHVPLLVLLMQVATSFPQLVVESLVLLLPFCLLSYLLTEKPFLKVRRNLRVPLAEDATPQLQAEEGEAARKPSIAREGAEA